MKNKEERYAGLTRRDFLYLSGVGMAGITLVGIPGRSEAQERKPKYGGILRIGERYGSTGLDAHRNQFFIDFQNYIFMYNALTEMGELPQVRMYPSLAKSWEISRDGREYIFPLREGVKFHHGKELDSGDVKYSIERVMNPATRSPRAFAYRWIDSVSIIDKYHLKVKLKEPFGPFLTTLTIQNCPVIPAKWEPTGVKPAPGTGPFVFKSFVPNETSEVTRFGQYWEIDEKTGNHLPYLDGIHMRKIVDETIRWTALRTGDLDYINVPPRNIVLGEMKKPTPGVVTVIPQPVAYMSIIFNTSKPPFDNKKVRQAVAYAIDKDEFIKAAYWGLTETVNNQPFSNRSQFYVPVKDRELDLAKARQLLAEAGYPKGFKTEFFTENAQIDCCNAVVGQLKKAGIDATIKVIDRAPYVESMRKGGYTISVRGDSERMDPDDAFYLWLHSGEIDKNNWSRYNNKELDALLEKGRTLWEWEKRMPVYQKIIEIIKEDLPLLYLSKQSNQLAYRDYVKGFGAGMATWFGYHGGGMVRVWLDK